MGGLLEDRFWGIFSVYLYRKPFRNGDFVMKKCNLSVTKAKKKSACGGLTSPQLLLRYLDGILIYQ